jgi:dihydroorotate dehydrogenase
VQVGTANFRNPGIGENILDSFDSFLDKTNRDSAFELIGSVKTHS